MLIFLRQEMADPNYNKMCKKVSSVTTSSLLRFVCKQILRGREWELEWHKGHGVVVFRLTRVHQGTVSSPMNLLINNAA
jgi:hypothetical protein